MDELEQRLARLAAGVDWKQNPILALGFPELVALNLPFQELHEIVKKFIRGVLSSYHPDHNPHNIRGHEIYKKFAEIGDMLDEPEIFAVAWREFRRLSEGLPVDALTRAEKHLSENRLKFQRLQEENALLEDKLYKEKGDRTDRLISLERSYQQRLQELLITPAFEIPPQQGIVAHRHEQLKLLTIRFHVEWGTNKTSGNPGAIVAQALSKENVLFPVVRFTANKTVNLRTPKTSPSIADITDNAILGAYRACLENLGTLIGRHKRVKTFWAIPTIVKVMGGRLRYASPEGSAQERVILGSLPLSHPQYRKSLIFITSKRDEEIEVVPAMAIFHLKPLIIERHLLVTARIKKIHDGIFVEQHIATHAYDVPLRAHELVVRILS